MHRDRAKRMKIRKSEGQEGQWSEQEAVGKKQNARSVGQVVKGEKEVKRAKVKE